MNTVSGGRTVDRVRVCISAQRAENERLIAEHQRLGEDLSEPRMVAHSARFSEELPALRVAVQLQRRGFSTDVAPDGADWRVSFVRDALLSSISMNLITLKVVEMVMLEGGIYEGWTALAVGRMLLRSSPR